MTSFDNKKVDVIANIASSFNLYLKNVCDKIYFLSAPHKKLFNFYIANIGFMILHLVLKLFWVNLFESGEQV